MSNLEKDEPTKEVFDELPNASLFSITQLDEGDCYDNMMNFLLDYQFPSQWSKDKKRQLALGSKILTIITGQMYKKGIDQMLRRCVQKHEKVGIL